MKVMLVSRELEVMILSKSCFLSEDDVADVLDDIFLEKAQVLGHSIVGL